MIGQTISHYRIVEKLGEGGMGVVYKAEDLKLGRAVALKFLRADVLESEEHKARFLQEARAAAVLDHPNICTVYEIDEAEGQTFLAMACLGGTTLKEKIGMRPLPLSEALNIAMQVGQGLQAAHENGIVHRDIKPANIMVTQQGQARIMDFGLAQLTDRTKLTATGMRLGTPAYMSPEQTEGKSAGRRTDIWSLGVVLYEMVTGRLPFAGEMDAAVAYAILHTEPEPPTALRSGLPVELDRIVAKALAKDPAESYQHVEDMLVDLRRLEREQATQRPDVSRRQREGPPVPAALPHNSARRIVAVVAAVVILAALASWISQRSTDSGENPLADARFTRVTDFEGDELDAAISADGSLVAFLSNREGPFDAWVGRVGTGEFVNLTKGQYPNLLNENLRNIGFSADASHVWFRVGEGLRAEKAWLVPTLGGAARPFIENSVSMEWSPDGERIVYHEFTAGDPIFVADRHGGNPIEIFRQQEGRHCHQPTWSPDGRFIYFTSGFPMGEMDIWRVPSDGGSPERITSHRSRVAYPTLLDDRTLLYTATADDGAGSCLYAMDLRRREAKRISYGLEQYISVAAERGDRREGRRLVATSSNPSGTLWSVPISERIVGEDSSERLDVSSPRASNPRFGSGSLLYLASTGPAHGLWAQKDESSTELWKAANGGLTASPAISPDGRQICFSFRRNDKAALYLMESDGTNLRLLTDAFEVRSAASWSPNGQWVVVAGDEGQGTRIFKVPLAGGAAVALVDGFSYNPVWSPDGRFILYSGENVGAYHPVKAITPEGESFPFPEINVLRSTEGYRFLPDGSGIVLLQGFFHSLDFWLFHLETGQLRQLTNLTHSGSAIKSFDVSPDGKRIVFDRLRQNSDVVLIELPGA
jgi:serine/threonine protein kinase